MKNKTLNAALAAIALAAAQSAYALDTGIDWLKVSGFGTLAVSHANLDKNNGAYFDPWFTEAGGTQDTWYAGTDSKVGAQATAIINPALSATLQVVSRKNYEGSFIPAVDWANLKYEFTPDISVRVGRMGLSAFLISDSLNVGYSQPWIRPPVDVYKFGPTENHVDGVDATFRFHAGDTAISLQPALGTSSYKTAFIGPVKEGKLTSLRAFNVVVENGAWTARYSNVRANLDLPDILSARLFDDFSSWGVIYDKDAWLVQGEYNRRTTSDLPSPAPGFVPPEGNIAQKMGYATVGYRIGTVMPNLTISRYVDESTTGLLGTTENTVSPGVRWDFRKNMAFKAQWDHITRPTSRNTSPFGGSAATYSGLFNLIDHNLQAPFVKNNHAVNVISFGIDFVF